MHRKCTCSVHEIILVPVVPVCLHIRGLHYSSHFHSFCILCFYKIQSLEYNILVHVSIKAYPYVVTYFSECLNSNCLKQILSSSRAGDIFQTASASKSTQKLLLFSEFARRRLCDAVSRSVQFQLNNTSPSGAVSAPACMSQ